MARITRLLQDYLEVCSMANERVCVERNPLPYKLSLQVGVLVKKAHLPLPFYHEIIRYQMVIRRLVYRV